MTRWNTTASRCHGSLFTFHEQAGRRASRQADRRANEGRKEGRKRQGVHRSSSCVVYTPAKPARKIGQVGRRREGLSGLSSSTFAYREEMERGSRP